MDIVDVAVGEIGATERNNGHRKYIAWYGGFGYAVPWCAIFVSWCANQAGVSTSVIPKYASCSVGRQWFESRGLFKYKGNYTPKRGDIIFFLNNAGHTGIVEKVQGNIVFTIEGNTSNMVARRTYTLTNAKITGYGTPRYASGSGSSGASGGSGSGSSAAKKDPGKELEYLKKILARTTVTEAAVSGEIESRPFTGDLQLELVIQNGTKQFMPPALDDVQLSLERAGNPGKLTFKTVWDNTCQIQEGNPVLLTVNGRKVFYGFVFTRDRQRDGQISITVYDQLRYLKNKDTYIYTNKTATQLIRLIAEDYRLQVGQLADTGAALSKVEDNITLMDMIQNALDETLLTRNELYVFYDDVGKLTLRNVKDMKVNTVIDEETGENYTYKTTIDADVYNQAKLAYENKDTGTLDVYLIKNSEKINEWGLLQYFEKIDSPEIGRLKANAVLKLYGEKKRSLKITGAFGDLAVRAGVMLPVMLDLGDVKLQKYMLVEKATHKFANREHKMDLILSGGDFGGD